ncbi:transmembrane protein 44 [Kryptolebias marmoratus]|uniref:transmembrane protein 44 n=1 Tax=Kryptolebias marmoratus TaxID=37003 RepID=UPI000D52FF40|nr:transmembrane protein 44 [Kryptolebias marmoratus]
MDGDGPVRRSSDSFLALSGLWLHTASTCFSADADKLCVPVGLTLVSALLLLLSCLLIVCQRCKFRGEYSGEPIIMFYSFMGNLCSSVGAILSGQLLIQVFMAVFAAVMDAVSCVLCCLPVFFGWNSKTQKRLRVIKRRRRQHLLAVGVLMVIAGGFLKSRDAEPPESRSIRGRRLLHVNMQITASLMDNSVILGYTLGLLSLVIALTSRFPALCRARRGQAFTQAYVFSGLLSSMSGALYTAAILLCDTRFGFLIRVLPWLLSSVSCVALDLLILLLHWCKRGIKQRRIKTSPDTESLLGSPAVHTEDAAVLKQQTIPSSVQTKTKNLQKLNEMGGYMDVSVQPTRKQMSLKEVTLSKGGVNLQRKVDNHSSSDTSYDSSSISSDLEWDFEAAISQWSKPAAKPQEGDEFPLQDWPTKSKPFKVCICSMSEQPRKTLCAANQGGSSVS